MDNLPFYLKTWGLPMLIVGLFYLVFLIPTYFLVKKYKPSYWLMLSMGILVVYLIDLIFAYSIINFKIGGFMIDLLYFSFLTNCLFFIFIPILIKNFIKERTKFNLVISYLFLFILQILFGYFLLVLIARGAASIIN